MLTTDQLLILGILAATVAAFLWGRWRHDMVALGALLACVAAGLVEPASAFLGLAQPAVVTVACVLVLSQALQSSGVVDVLTRKLVPQSAGPMLSIAALTGLAAVLSGFMNNVGALALLMPVALQMAKRQSMPPGRILMPLAFGSILGGMTTLVGTPPNLIVSGFRATQGDGSYGMFDFTPVGLAVALAGVLFIALGGWRLVPARERRDAEGFETGAYITEARVTDKSKAVDKTIREVEAELEKAEAQIVALVRNEVRVTAPNPSRRVRAGDILIIEAEADRLSEALETLSLKLEESVRSKEEDEAADRQAEQQGDAPTTDDENGGRKRSKYAARRADQGGDRAQTTPDGDREGDGEEKEEDKEQEKGADNETDKEKDDTAPADEIALIELAVRPESMLNGRSATDVDMRSRFGINLLAISRQGRRSVSRLRTMPIQAGDVLLMQGPPEAVMDFANQAGCVPLATRNLRIPDHRKAITASVIMLLAIAGAALGLVPAAISFAAGVLATMALRTLPMRSIYESIDWSVVVLLAALIPVAGAMDSTGTATLLAVWMVDGIAQGHAVFALALILVVTMTLSDLMNNAATAAVMCPIAISIAAQLGVNADPFLMAVAVGASCAFLTPIGHQNNTLILGPGGFRFGDYWRLGLPMELLVIAVSIPALLWAWPM